MADNSKKKSTPLLIGLIGSLSLVSAFSFTYYAIWTEDLLAWKLAQTSWATFGLIIVIEMVRKHHDKSG